MAVFEGSVFTMAEAFGNPHGPGDDLEACRERNCAEPAALQCTYIDSRGRLCGTWWCPRHLTRIGEGSYCRRHASTVAALGGKGNDPRALPPVDHRGPSLVNWIVTEGHEDLSQAVAAGMRPGEILFEDHTVNIVRGADRSRRWERGWRIGDRSGITAKVSICVDESDDAVVNLRVDDRVVAQGVPPWITRRRRGEVVPRAVDTDDRRQFYAFLVRFVARGLEARPAGR